MKKFFFITSFLVFLGGFSFAYAFNPVPFSTSYISSNNFFLVSTSGLENTFCWKVYHGIFPDTSTPYTNFTGPSFQGSGSFNTECGNATTFFTSGGIPLTNFSLYPYGHQSVANSDLWIEFTFVHNGTTSDTMDDSGGSYYVGYHADGLENATIYAPVVNDGIQSQTQPIPNASISANVPFIGTFNSTSGTWDQIEVILTSPYSSVFPRYYHLPILMSGLNQPYSFTELLDTNTEYTYTLRLFDSTNNLFSASTAPITFTTGSIISPPAGPLTDIVRTPEACTWSDVSTWTGCFDNLIYNLLAPSPESLQRFGNLYDTYVHKPPFGYISAIQTQLASINDTETSAFTLQSMPILNTYIFDPLRTAIIWVLWLAFAFVLYHRFKNIAL